MIMFDLIARKSMRIKLLTLIISVSVLSIGSLAAGVIVIQKGLLTNMETSVVESLGDNNSQIKRQFQDMGQQVSRELQQLPESAGKKLATATALPSTRSKKSLPLILRPPLNTAWTRWLNCWQR